MTEKELVNLVSDLLAQASRPLKDYLPNSAVADALFSHIDEAYEIALLYKTSPADD